MMAGHKLGGEIATAPFNRSANLTSKWFAGVSYKNSGAVAGHKLGGEIATAPFNRVSPANGLQVSVNKNSGAVAGHKLGEIARRAV